MPLPRASVIQVPASDGSNSNARTPASSSLNNPTTPPELAQFCLEYLDIIGKAFNNVNENPQLRRNVCELERRMSMAFAGANGSAPPSTAPRSEEQRVRTEQGVSEAELQTGRKRKFTRSNTTCGTCSSAKVKCVKIPGNSELCERCVRLKIEKCPEKVPGPYIRKRAKTNAHGDEIRSPERA